MAKWIRRLKPQIPSANVIQLAAMEKMLQLEAEATQRTENRQKAYGQCGQKWHRNQTDCKKRFVKCFSRCGKSGHFAKMKKLTRRLQRNMQNGESEKNEIEKKKTSMLNHLQQMC
ncbi:nucleolar MIF4G domain-containing protein 1 [Trichinella spiralis]|uniref:nucleolar MIF4G domain-containing protein 1 n=1 Tax=Trichinella spiralis TaxID=6334 RepID=UPI0001EFC068|nr:nucleolar MIF4G domain-containing protein 1 [Trichinella spiralis]